MESSQDFTSHKLIMGRTRDGMSFLADCLTREQVATGGRVMVLDKGPSRKSFEPYYRKFDKRR